MIGILLVAFLVICTVIIVKSVNDYKRKQLICVLYEGGATCEFVEQCLGLS